jgi:hypothetical protein
LKLAVVLLLLCGFVVLVVWFFRARAARNKVLTAATKKLRQSRDATARAVQKALRGRR